MKELRELDNALCNLLNGAFDPYDPVDLWRDEVWNAMAVLAHAYNAAHEARCFPDWKSDASKLPDHKAFRNWQHEISARHDKFRLKVFADENNRPLSAEALSMDGKTISHWARTEKTAQAKEGTDAT